MDRPTGRRFLLAAAAMVGMAGSTAAQDSSRTSRSADDPRVAVEDFFVGGSGPAGVRDWDRVRRAFAPDAAIITTATDSTGAATTRRRSVDEYIAGAGEYARTNALHERPTRCWTERYASLAAVFCAFEARRDPGDADPFYRGVASFQLTATPGGWRIVSATWLGERPGVPLPSRYRSPEH